MGWKTTSFSLKSHLKEFLEVKHFFNTFIISLVKDNC